MGGKHLQKITKHRPPHILSSLYEAASILHFPHYISNASPISHCLSKETLKGLDEEFETCPDKIMSSFSIGLHYLLHLTLLKIHLFDDHRLCCLASLLVPKGQGPPAINQHLRVCFPRSFILRGLQMG